MAIVATHTRWRRGEIQIDKMEERERRRRTQPLSPIKVDPNSTTGDIRKRKYKRGEGKKKKGVETGNSIDRASLVSPTLKFWRKQKKNPINIKKKRKNPF